VHPSELRNPLTSPLGRNRYGGLGFSKSSDYRKGEMMTERMSQESLLCGYEIVSVGNKADLRKQGTATPVYSGTYKQVKTEAKRRGLLMSQAPFRGGR
jgi:hypothetical protein